MADSKESDVKTLFQEGQSRDIKGRVPYASPEFKTISAAGRPKKRADMPAPKPFIANEIKPFSIDELFLTDS
ncbi:MAG: hypothetical protein GQ535_07430 [Rhodobacteraceae bacterium]|nr:hypothetical protein [Paracoccaceae bacterium]